MLGRLVNDHLQRVPPAYPWGDTLRLFRESDWRMCNLECAISDRGTPWERTEKTFHFRSDAKNVAVLRAAGIDAVSLANNHVLDFEAEAFFDTLEILDKQGIRHAGAGRNLDDAMKPAVFDLHGIKLGMIAFTDNQPDWEATPDRPGIFYVPIDARDDRAHLLLERIRAVRKQTDLLIASAHWGPNWGYEPPAAHVEFAHLMIDAGANIIFGHSGHIFRGIEFYRSRPIIYCAGNFIDDYAVDPVERNDESFVFVVDLRDPAVSGLRLFPTVVDDFQARMARGDRAKEVATKMSQLCGKLGSGTRWNETETALEVFPSTKIKRP